MKKILLAGFSILIGLQLFANPVSAYLNPAPDHADSDYTGAVSERLLKAFRESFPNAEKVTWDESHKYYTVSFVEQGILTRIDYEKDGEFAGSIRYYTERSLPYYLINFVKHKYPGHKIYGVTEIAAFSSILYYIKLEGPKHWLTVVLNSEGESFIQDKYRKAL
jgi:hypothetical protein